MNLVTQLRQAVRKLWTSPGFALLSILTLAIGIGANTAIFSVVDTVLLQPLPYPQADRLVGVWHTAPGLNLDQIGLPDAAYMHYRAHNQTLEGLALYSQSTVSLTGDGNPERAQAATVTGSFFSVLQAQPALGRTLREEDERPGAPPVLVLSHQLWQRRFGGTPQVVGQTVKVDGTAREVVGVMPERLSFLPSDTELWLPQTIDPANLVLGRFSFNGIGRLRAGVSVADAETDFNRLLGNLSETFPNDRAARVLANAGMAARIHALRDDVVGDAENTIWLLLGAVGFVLLIACANVANLFLTRTEGRQREAAIRTAMGANRGQLISEAFIESLLLGLLSGGVGLGLSALGLRFLLHDAPDVPRLDEVAINPRVLAFTALIALLTSLLFGLIPALRSAVRDLVPLLKDGGKNTTAGRRRVHARHMLVAAQIALALVLLVGSGLMARSLAHLANVHPGFTAEGVLTFELSLPASDYADDLAVARFYQQLVDRLETLPGVTMAAVSSALPLTNADRGSGHVFADFPLGEDDLPQVLYINFTSQNYFKTMEIPLIEGRVFTPADHEQRASVVLISEGLARERWPQGSALGKRIFPGRTDGPDRWYEIVGVVGNVHYNSLREEPDDMVYYPMANFLSAETGFFARQMEVVVRTQGEPLALVDTLRHEVWNLDPNLPIANVRTLEQIRAQDNAGLQLTVVMLAIAAGVALSLGAIGTYGVISYLVSQRTSEIGVRMAVGAHAGDIHRMVLWEGILVALGGIGVGLAGALALTRSLEALLFEVSPLDPATFLAVPVVLLAVVLFACYLPARRAARIDPLQALRHE